MTKRKRDRCPWLFVIDTDQYSGNFEREMGAYLTGQVRKYFGDISEILGLFYSLDTDANDDTEETVRLKKILGLHEHDSEHGCSYVDGWSTPGWFNNGVGGSFREGQEVEALAHHKRECLKEAKKTTGLHPDDRERHRQMWLDRAKEPLHKYPAGRSVAIAFIERPSHEQQLTLTERAKAFPAAFRRAEKVKQTIVKNDEDLPNFIRARQRWTTGPFPMITGIRLLHRTAPGERYEAVRHTESEIRYVSDKLVDRSKLKRLKKKIDEKLQED